MKSEDEVMQLIRLEAPKHGITLWRNNCGAFQDSSGRWIRFGLANESVKSPLASSDLIGLTLTGKFVAIECKKSGWTFKGDEREQKQADFLNVIGSRGCPAGFAQSVDDFKRIIGAI